MKEKKWKVLVTAPYMIPFPDEFRHRLENENVEIITASVNECLSETELLPLVKDFDGVICGDDQFTDAVFQAAPRLKVISKWGTGINSIALNAARKYGVEVYNTPNAFTEAVADTVMGYILCFARNLFQMNRDVRNGLWAKPQSVSLGECTLGVIGIGNIGKAITRRAKAFGMQVIGNDIVSVSSSFIAETEIVMMPLYELLEKSDYVSLNCDLNETSFHLIGRKELSAMKPGAVLINTSRGHVVNESALIEAIKKNQIAGAALDVFETEPLPESSELREFQNCLLAPHNSNSSPLARRKVHESTIFNLIKGLRQA